MDLKDKNETLQPPSGELQSVSPVGSFLCVQYRDWDAGLETRVYLNDQGREVLRTSVKVSTRAEEIESAERSAEVLNGTFRTAAGTKPTERPEGGWVQKVFRFFSLSW